MNINQEVNELTKLCVANDLNKLNEILNVFYKKNAKSLSVENLARELKITERQIYFYIQAGTQLASLFDLKQKIVTLTSKGMFFAARHTVLQAYLVKTLLSDKFLNQLISMDDLSSSKILEELKKDEQLTSDYSEASLNRRASSIFSWCKYISNYKNNLESFLNDIIIEVNLMEDIKSL